MAEKTLFDLCERHYDYPPGELKILGFRPGVCFNYVSSDYLNAFINCVKPIKAYVAGRYLGEGDMVKVTDSYMEPAGSFNWVKPTEPWTKRAVFDMYSQPQRTAHTRLGVFKDDVVILAHVEETNVYAFFWFDQDVSDCTIALFDPHLFSSTAELITLFDTFVTTNEELNRKHKVWEFPVASMDEWLSF